MNTQKGSSTSMAVLNIVMLIVFLLSSFFAGLYLGETNKISLFNKSYLLAENQKSYKNGYNAALKYVRDKLISLNMMAKSATFIQNATVKSVSGQNVVVEFKASEIDLLQDGNITRTVQIPSALTIEKHISKTSDEIKKITDEYEKKMKVISANQKAGKDVTKELSALSVPELYTVTKLQPRDLKVGDVLNIQSKTDIYASATFEASAIKLISSNK